MHEGKLIVTDALALVRPTKSGQYKYDTVKANAILDLGDIEYANVWHIITKLDPRSADRVLRQVFSTYVDYYCMSKLWADARVAYMIDGETQFFTEHGFKDGYADLLFSVHCNVEADEVDTLIADIAEGDYLSESVVVSPDVEHGYVVQDIISYFGEFNDGLNDYDEDEDRVTTGMVYNRALRHFGNPELAREAAEMYPGDFM